MKPWSRYTLAGGLAAGIGFFVFDRLYGKPKITVIVNQKMPAAASNVIDIIKQVERESELIPFISSVTVHERSKSSVRYTVQAAAGVPAAVHYFKMWDYDEPAVYWCSERGTLGFHHNGVIRFVEKNGQCEAQLSSEHWLTAPLIGRLTGSVLKAAMETALEIWFRRISSLLEEEKE